MRIHIERGQKHACMCVRSRAAARSNGDSPSFNPLIVILPLLPPPAARRSLHRPVSLSPTNDSLYSLVPPQLSPHLARSALCASGTNALLLYSSSLYSLASSSPATIVCIPAARRTPLHRSRLYFASLLQSNRFLRLPSPPLRFFQFFFFSPLLFIIRQA